MAAGCMAWSDLRGANECEIRMALSTTEGIPESAYPILISYIRAGVSIPSTTLNSLDIEPIFWAQFDEEEPEFEHDMTMHSDDLKDLETDVNYDLIGEIPIEILVDFTDDEDYSLEAQSHAQLDQETEGVIIGENQGELSGSNENNVGDEIMNSESDDDLLHENYADETIMRASSDSDLTMPSRNGRTSRSLTRTSLQNRPARATRSHTPSQANMPPPKKPVAPRKGKALLGKSTLVKGSQTGQQAPPVNLEVPPSTSSGTPLGVNEPNATNSSVVANASTVPSFEEPQENSPTVVNSPVANIAFDIEAIDKETPSVDDAASQAQLIMDTLESIPTIVRNEFNDRAPAMIEDLVNHIDIQLDSKLTPLADSIRNKLKASIMNELSNSVSRLVNSHMDGILVKVNASMASIANLQPTVASLSEKVAKLTEDVQAVQSQQVSLEIHKNAIIADCTSRSLEHTANMTLQFQAKINALEANNFQARINALEAKLASISLSQPQVSTVPTQTFNPSILTPIPASISSTGSIASSIPASVPASGPVPVPVSVPTNIPASVPTTSNATATGMPAQDPLPLLVDKLADLVNHKDREDPPVFDGRESFVHFLSTFEDFIADWKIPESKWKHLLNKSLRKGFESAIGKENHRLEMFLCHTTMKHLTYEGLVAAAKKHFENDSPNTYYEMLVHAAQKQQESLKQWYNRVYSMYRDILKYETSRENEVDRKRITTLAGEIFISKVNDTGLRTHLAASDTKNKSLEALYHLAEKCLRAVMAHRGAVNKPAMVVAQVAEAEAAHTSAAEGASTIPEPETCQVARAQAHQNIQPAPDNQKLFSEMKSMLSSIVAAVQKPPQESSTHSNPEQQRRPQQQGQGYNNRQGQYQHDNYYNQGQGQRNNNRFGGYRNRYRPDNGGRGRFNAYNNRGQQNYHPNRNSLNQ